MSKTIIHVGDCRTILPTLAAQSVHCCVTSPPYFGLRDYGVDGQIGLEQTPDAYVAEMVGVFREVWRVLRDDGTLWLNLGDSYARAGGWSNNNGLDGVATRQESSRPISNLDGAGGKSQRLAAGLKTKDLIGIPWRVAFALQADGWYLRQDIIWSKPNPMPESVKDRCTKAHEYIFMLTKSARYFYDQDAIAEKSAYPNDKRRPLGSKGAWELDGREQRENGGGQPYDHDTETRNKRSVWTVATKPYSEAHFATFPPALIEPCILAGCPKDGTVLDPFGGAGTTGLVAARSNRDSILIDLNLEYAQMSKRRLQQDVGLLGIVQLHHKEQFDAGSVS